MMTVEEQLAAIFAKLEEMDALLQRHCPTEPLPPSASVSVAVDDGCEVDDSTSKPSVSSSASAMASSTSSLPPDVDAVAICDVTASSLGEAPADATNGREVSICIDTKPAAPSSAPLLVSPTSTPPCDTDLAIPVAATSLPLVLPTKCLMLCLNTDTNNDPAVPTFLLMKDIPSAAVGLVETSTLLSSSPVVERYYCTFRVPAHVLWSPPQLPWVFARLFRAWILFGSLPLSWPSLDTFSFRRKSCVDSSCTLTFDPGITVRCAGIVFSMCAVRFLHCTTNWKWWNYWHELLVGAAQDVAQEIPSYLSGDLAFISNRCSVDYPYDKKHSDLLLHPDIHMALTSNRKMHQIWLSTEIIDADMFGSSWIMLFWVLIAHSELSLCQVSVKLYMRAFSDQATEHTYVTHWNICDCKKYYADHNEGLHKLLPASRSWSNYVLFVQWKTSWPPHFWFCCTETIPTEGLVRLLVPPFIKLFPEGFSCDTTDSRESIITIELHLAWDPGNGAATVNSHAYMIKAVHSNGPFLLAESKSEKHEIALVDCQNINSTHQQTDNQFLVLEFSCSKENVGPPHLPQWSSPVTWHYMCLFLGSNQMVSKFTARCGATQLKHEQAVASREVEQFRRPVVCLLIVQDEFLSNFTDQEVKHTYCSPMLFTLPEHLTIDWYYLPAAVQQAFQSLTVFQIALIIAELAAPWDPGDSMFVNNGLGESRVLRTGECHDTTVYYADGWAQAKECVRILLLGQGNHTASQLGSGSRLGPWRGHERRQPRSTAAAAAEWVVE